MASKTLKYSQFLLLFFFTEALIPLLPRSIGAKLINRALSTVCASVITMPPLLIETPALTAREQLDFSEALTLTIVVGIPFGRTNW